jgi:elongator complex protein 1
VDLNVLVDHNAAAFFHNVELFVQQLANQTHLNLFLSSIRNEDVTQTLFANRDDKRSDKQLPAYLSAMPVGVPVHSTLIAQPDIASLNANVGDISTKVNRVCNAIRHVLVAQEPQLLRNPMLLSILTTYVRSTPPQLAEALLVIKQLREVEAQQLEPTDEQVTDTTANLSAGSALEYVIFLANVDLLFNV